MIRTRTVRALVALLLALLALAGCRREPEPETVAAPGDPVAAVQAQVQALRDNDLVRYSRLSLPADLHARSEALWTRRQAQAEPPDPEDAREYADLMARLTAPDAEQALMRDLEPKLAKLESEIAGQWPLMQATASIFLNAANQANTELSEAERSHGTEVVGALLEWARPELFTDRERARRAVVALSATARELDLPTLEQARALPLVPAMEKGGVALAGLKQAAKAYDLDIDQTLDGVQAKLLSAEGDRATVQVSYPLAGRTITFDLAMARRDDGWYSADTLRQTEAELAEAERDADAAATNAPEATPDADAGAAAPAAAGNAG